MSKKKSPSLHTANSLVSSHSKACILTFSHQAELEAHFGGKAQILTIGAGFDFDDVKDKGWLIVAESVKAAQVAYQALPKTTRTTLITDQKPIQGLWASLFSPYDMAGSYAGAAILPAERAKEILTHPLIKIGLPYVLKHLNIPITTLAEKNLQAPKTSIATYLTQNARAFGYRFFIEPFQSSLKTVLSDPNHPLYRFKFLAFLAFMAIVMPVLSFDYGITWDEPEHVSLAQDMRKYYTSLGADTSVFDLSKHARYALLYYGASIDLLAEMVYHYLSPFGIYETRHFINALYGVLGGVFTGLIARELGGWRAAFLAAVLMLLSPRYFGHSMNNPKDVPFLTGYAISLYFLILLIKQLPRPRLGTIWWTGFGVAFAISLKIGGILNLAYVGLFMGVWWLYYIRQNGLAKATRLIPQLTAIFGVVAIIGYFLGILFWPYGLVDPFTNPFKALKEFTNFQLLLTYELFEGERLFMQNVPPHYIFKWILISVPVAVLGGCLVGMLMPMFRKPDSWQFVVWAMMVFALFFPILYIIYKKSTLYSEWRHVMFVYTPIIVLTAYGWESLWRLGRMGWIAGLVLLALMVRPAVWMISNHPYQYLYFNEIIGGIKGAYANYETDYWCHSMKAAAEWMLTNRPEIKNKRTVIATNFAHVTAQYYFDKETDSVKMLWVRENDKYKQDWDYAFFGTRTMCKAHILNAFPPKGTIHTIDVDGVPILAIVEKQDHNHNLSLKAYAQKNDSLALYYGLKALEYDDKNVETYRHLAQVYLSMNNLDKAMEMSQRCLKVNPEDFTSYTIQGMILSQRGQYQEALAALEKSIRYKINNVGAYQYKAQVLLKMGDLDKAYEAMEKAIEYDQGRSANVFYDAAYICVQQAVQMPALKLQYFDKAYRHLSQCLAISPNYAEAYNMMAYIFEQAGRPEEAQQFRQKYQQLIRK